jgi:nucleolar MIF4G domain-containing protein 1
MIVLVQSKASKYSDIHSLDRLEGQEQFPLGRVQFMLEAIYDLKNNRHRLSDANERLLPLRNWLRRQCSADGVDRQLRVSWRDLIAADVNGRWWIVGSAWNGPAGGQGDSHTGKHPSLAATSSLSCELQALQGSEQLLSLAKARHMNTDVRRAVFCVIMGADDYMHAFERLVRLDLRSPKDRDVAFVLIDCCGAERLYNAYYSYLATQLCRFQRAYKFTFTISLWDIYKRFGDANALTPRQACNIARLSAHLVAEFFISLAHLKNVQFENLGGVALLFFNVFFKALLSLRLKTLGAVFERISAKSVPSALLFVSESYYLTV